MKIASRALSLIIACCAAVPSLAVPALSQSTDQILSEEEELLQQQELRRDELAGLIAEKEAALSGLTAEILRLTGEIAVQNTLIEILADELEETVDARREPEAIRSRIALISFRKEDARQSGLVIEVRSLDGRTETTRRRVLYDSVIDEASRRLDEFDLRLRELTDQIAAARQLVAELQAEIGRLEANQQEIREEIAAAQADLDTTLLEIDNTLVRIGNTTAPMPKAVLTGLEVEAEVSRPALVVKIDNVGSAMPQSGINQADIVYVELVESATRLAAVFHSTAPAEVGPVRSMRTSDFDLLAALNGPLFASSGGNRGTRAALAESTLVDVGVGTAAHLYYRSPGRRAPHNLYTNPQNLWSAYADSSAAGLPPPLLAFRGPNEPRNPNAVPARSIDIDYRSSRIQYAWNGSGWDRTQDGKATFDSAGVRTSPATVIVQSTNYGRSAADSRSPEAITVGSGTALIFSDGHVVQGRWSRQRATDVTIYTDSQGQRISVLPGQTWVELPRPNSTTYS